MGIIPEYFFRVEGLVREYRKGDQILRPLNNVSFGVRRQEILVITGASGAGKSTLLHLMGLLDRPTRGAVYLEDTNLSALSASQQSQIRNKKISFIFQFYHLLPEFSALENVMLPRLITQAQFRWRDLWRLWRWRRPADVAQAQELLERVGLAHRMHHRPSELSGGECQRVAVARALINHPQIVLCDEPTGNLDERNSRDIQDLIWQFNQEFGQTFVIVTHDTSIAEQGHRVFRMRDGMLTSTRE